MKTFTDAAGRTWTLSLTLGTAMAVKDTLGIDLLQPEIGYPGPDDPPLLTRLGTDEMLLGEVLCAMLASQFETHNVTPDDVRNGFDGETLLAAQKAFYEELIGFFQSRGRADRAKAVAAQMKMIDAAVAMIETRIESLDIDLMVATAVNQIGQNHGPMSGESPEVSV